MMPLEDSVKDMKFYYKRKLKWYEKLWHFLNGKKEEYQELGPIKSLGDDE